MSYTKQAIVNEMKKVLDGLADCYYHATQSYATEYENVRGHEEKKLRGLKLLAQFEAYSKCFSIVSSDSEIHFSVPEDNSKIMRLVEIDYAGYGKDDIIHHEVFLHSNHELSIVYEGFNNGVLCDHEMVYNHVICESQKHDNILDSLNIILRQKLHNVLPHYRCVLRVWYDDINITDMLSEFATYRINPNFPNYQPKWDYDWRRTHEN